jgi:TetR/AcrR family transcriptional repressor of nem operon
MRNKERVIEVAGHLFRERGFDGVGIEDLMAGAGLTRGGFYKSFASKEGLVEAACRQAVERSAETWDTLLAQDDPLAALADFYLSAPHRDNPAKGCPYAALAAEAHRRPNPVRRVFTEGIGGAITRMARLMPGRAADRRRESAVAALAGMVGALILARAVEDPALSDEILASTRRTIAAGASSGSR